MAKAVKKKRVAKKEPVKKPAKVDKGLLPGTEITILPGLVPLLAPIQDVHPDPANPRRTLNLDVLKSSFRRFGVRKPIVANQKDGQIEAGHQTREALLQLGATHVPVVWADDDRLEATAFNITDNRSSEVVAEWDEIALAKLVKELDDEEMASGMGFDDNQIEGLIASFSDGDGEGDDDDEGGGTGFDDNEGESNAGNRVIIVYEGGDQKKKVEALLGIELSKIIYTYEEIVMIKSEDKDAADKG
jgi:hypothetical protein